MLFSIVVPVYNSSSTIRNCLDSILNQSYTDYEVIIINDGSTDDSAQICKEYEDKYEKFKLYTYENEGVAVSRRKGISKATGEFIIFVDSDDYVSENLLWEVAERIRIYPKLDIVRYQVNLINDESWKNHQRYNFESNIDTVMNGVEALKLWTCSKRKYALYWLFAFKKTLFSENGEIPNLKCYEDVAYIPLLIASAKEVITIEYHGYNYTCNRKDSLTNSDSITKQKERAKDFYGACLFAVEKFSKLKCVKEEDISFFRDDYNRRLQSFYEGICDELKEEFSLIYQKNV